MSSSIRLPDGTVVTDCFSSHADSTTRLLPSETTAASQSMYTPGPEEFSLDAESDKVKKTAQRVIDTTARSSLISFKKSKNRIELDTETTSLLNLLYKEDTTVLLTEPQQNLNSPTGTVLVECMTSKKKPRGWLDKDCNKFRSNNLRSFNERAVWTCYMVLVWIAWNETPIADEADITTLTPLVLLPIELVKPSQETKHLWSLKSTNSPRLNISFREKLSGLGLKIEDLPEGNTAEGYIDNYTKSVVEKLNEHGVPAKVSNERPSIVELSYRSEAVYRDLQENAGTFVNSPAHRAVCSQTKALAGKAAGTEVSGRPGQLFGLDDSQESAVISALAGNSLVLHGPPGTGKSQTIAAMIAELVRRGKTVLFVAEKATAVTAVTKRLKDKNNSDFVIDLFRDDAPSAASYKKWAARNAHLRTHQAAVYPNSYADEAEDFYEKINSYRSFMTAELNKAEYKHGFSNISEMLSSYEKFVITLGYEPDSSSAPTIWEVRYSDLSKLLNAGAPHIVKALETASGEPLWSSVVPSKLTEEQFRDMVSVYDDVVKNLQSLDSSVSEDYESLGLTLKEMTSLIDATDLLVHLRKAKEMGLSFTGLSLDEVKDVCERFTEAAGYIATKVSLDEKYGDIANLPYAQVGEAYSSVCKVADAVADAKSALRDVGVTNEAGDVGQIIDGLRAVYACTEHRVNTAVLCNPVSRTEAIAAIQALDKAFLQESHIASIFPTIPADLMRFYGPRVYNWFNVSTDQTSTRKAKRSVSKDMKKNTELPMRALNKAIRSNTEELLNWLESIKNVQEAATRVLNVFSPAYQAGASWETWESPKELAYIENHLNNIPTTWHLKLGIYAGGHVHETLVRLQSLLLETEELYKLYPSISVEDQALDKIDQHVSSLKSQLADLEPKLKIYRADESSDLTIGGTFHKITSDRIEKSKQELSFLAANCPSLSLTILNMEDAQWEACKGIMEGIRELLDRVAPIFSIQINPIFVNDVPLQHDILSKRAATEKALQDSLNLVYAGSNSVSMQVWRAFWLMVSRSQDDKTRFKAKLDYLTLARSKISEIATEFQQLKKELDDLLNKNTAAADVADSDDVRRDRLIAHILAPILKSSWSHLEYLGKTEFGTTDLDPITLENHLKEYRAKEKYASDAEGDACRGEIDTVSKEKLERLDKDVRDHRKFVNYYHGYNPHKSSKTPLRSFLKKPGAMEYATSLTPCFVCSPQTVSMYLPHDFLFDYVIFDEASQIFPVSAIGALGRAAAAVVAGDSQQLPPTSFFRSSAVVDDNPDDTLEEYQQEANDDQESLMDLANKASRDPFYLIEERDLKWHYRSRHDSLIRFSNEKFYDDKLLWFPSTERRKSTPDSRIPADGTHFVYVPEAKWESGRGVNEGTASKSFELAERSLAAGKSVGIVTFSANQAQYIQELILNGNRQLPHGTAWDYDDPIDGFFIKNIENVQGDEREVIILDFPYGHEKESGEFHYRFGPILNKGGNRRLNVAITRSRNSLYVVSGVKSSDFIGNPSDNVALIRDFIKYAENPDNISNHTTTSLGQKTESVFEDQVLTELNNYLTELLAHERFEMHTQIGCAPYRIDLAVYDRYTEQFVLGIECDGAQYHSSRHARSRDRIRHDQIVSMGWSLYHIWGGYWFGNREVALQALKDRVKKALDTAVHNSAQTSYRSR